MENGDAPKYPQLKIFGEINVFLVSSELFGRVKITDQNGDTHRGNSPKKEMSLITHPHVIDFYVDYPFDLCFSNGTF